MIRRVLTTMAVAVASVTWPLTSGAETLLPLRVENAWIRAAPPGVMALAGYMTLFNDGDGDITVVGASSPGFQMIEMHRSVVEGGMARMMQQDVLTVRARGRLVLEPNGLHLMLMMPTAALSPGDGVTLTLKLADGRSVNVQAVVKTTGGH